MSLPLYVQEISELVNEAYDEVNSGAKGDGFVDAFGAFYAVGAVHKNTSQPALNLDIINIRRYILCHIASENDIGAVHEISPAIVVEHFRRLIYVTDGCQFIRAVLLYIGKNGGCPLRLSHKNGIPRPRSSIRQLIS